MYSNYLNRLNMNNYFNNFINFFKYLIPIQYLGFIYKKENKLIKNPEKQLETQETKQEIKQETKQETKQIYKDLYEIKYLDKYKKFTNDYFLNNEEKELLERIKKDLKQEGFIKINESIKIIKNNLKNIQNILNLLEYDYENGLIKLLDYYDEYYDYEESEESEEDKSEFKEEEKKNKKRINISNETYKLFLNKLKEELKYYENEYQLIIKEKELLYNNLSLSQFEEKANNIIINKKLENFINNYILEKTPLGIVLMRYNLKKGSFEYFSNNNIPYRFLEPIGRKYVTTYFCKKLYVDLENELNKNKEKQEKQKEEQEKQKKQKKEQKQEINKTKEIFANFKSYNKNSITNQTNQLKSNNLKNRNDELSLNNSLKSKFVINEEKDNLGLLKENANRYTWEGRLSSFQILKKIDRKLVDKKYGLTFSDYKKMFS